MRPYLAEPGGSADTNVFAVWRFPFAMALPVNGGVLHCDSLIEGGAVGLAVDGVMAGEDAGDSYAAVCRRVVRLPQPPPPRLVGLLGLLGLLGLGTRTP